MKFASGAVFLFLAFSSASLSACGENYPKEVWIGGNFSASEEQMIILAMSRWEEQTGWDLFSYRGRTKARDFRKENLGDGVFVIYKVESWDEGDAREIWDFKDPGYGDGVQKGWATAGDMLIFVSGFDGDESENEYLRDLFGVLLHEFGHVLFLGHIKDDRTVMNPDGDYDNCLTSDDLEAFCSMNICDGQYSPEDAEAACRERHGKRIY